MNVQQSQQLLQLLAKTAAQEKAIADLLERVTVLEKKQKTLSLPR